MSNEMNFNDVDNIQVASTPSSTTPTDVDIISPIRNELYMSIPGRSIQFVPQEHHSSLSLSKAQESNTEKQAMDVTKPKRRPASLSSASQLTRINSSNTSIHKTKSKDRSFTGHSNIPLPLPAHA